MKNLTLNDETQQALLPHLEVTERLLAQVASMLSGRDCGAEIWAMPDLGFPSNVTRAYGGFLTGAYYAWETDVPFVPVDATVNSCGTSLWRLRGPIADERDFQKRLSYARCHMAEQGHIWNYASGNHFITYGRITEADCLDDGYYLVIHSSAAECKRQHWGLYPEPGNWFWSDIRVETDRETGRHLRYISGDAAVRFIGMAHALPSFNRKRHRWLAHAIAAGIGIAEEVINLPHYGMPDDHSVAIGCHWWYGKSNERGYCLLLTGPGLPIYVVDPEDGGPNRPDEYQLLTPHGLGMRATQPPTLAYDSQGLTVNGRLYGFDEPMKGAAGMELRSFETPADGSVPGIVSDVLGRCPGDIVATFMPVFSYP